jgi:hypothetical protein
MTASKQNPGGQTIGPWYRRYLRIIRAQPRHIRLRIRLQYLLDHGELGAILGELTAALGTDLQRAGDVFDLAVFVVEETQFFCPFLCAGKPMMKEATALATMRSMLSGGFT